MRARLALFIATAIAGLAVTAGAAQATTVDSCADFGPGGINRCFAGTIEQRVDFGLIQFGRHSYGTFTLVCADYGGRVVRFKQGNVGVNGSRNLSTDALFGFRNPDCVLTAQAIGQLPGQNAHVRVTLVS